MQNPDSRSKLLESYLRKVQTEDINQPRKVPRRDPENPIPLSFGQQQLWLSAQVIEDAPVYSECVTIHIPGSLDVSALERSLLEVLRRHEAWRTSFPIINDQPVQMIHPPQLDLPVVDLRAEPPEQREAEALRLATAEALLPFDLARGPLLRAMLVHLSDTEHRLYLAMHHIIFDGVSLYQIFLPELWALYEAFSLGKPSPLAEPALQYADYAAWQRGKERESALKEHLAYWKRQLAGAPSALDLPVDHPLSARQSFQGAMLPFALSPSLTGALKTMSNREGVTLYMTLMAALYTLLYRYSGQDDILIGAAMDGRNRLELQGIMGYFLNTLVIRSDLSGDPTFQELLRRVRDVVLDAHAHQDAPFEYLVRTLQPERVPGRNPFFQVMMSLEPPLATPPSGWTLTQMDVETETAKFDLNIELDDRPGGLIGRFEYNSDLFDEATVERMVRHWITILESAAANPEQSIATLPLLSEQERHHILVDWNASEQSFAPECCIHRMFEEQVRRAPDAIALVYETESLTYEELNRRANQLAHYLMHIGIGPDTSVGLRIDRSLDMIVAMMGILKAGGAYVPLDVGFPPARIAYMLRVAGAKVVITQHHLAGMLEQDGVRIIDIDADWEAISEHSDQNPQPPVTPEHLAYVIFTSGSTGAPKGTMIEHRQLYNYVRGISERLHLPAGASYATVSTIAGDLGNTCIYPALTSGGTLHVIAQDRVYDPDAFADHMRRHALDYLKLTPSYMATLLTAEHPEWVFPRRALLMGGEFSHWSLIERIKQYAPTCQILNHYGPTETTVGVATYVVTGGMGRPNAKTVPVGRPLPNSRLYILDQQRQPVPIGVAGELYIGGSGLARGYLNRPDLTDDRFIPDPFNAGERFYRTGDLARYLDDGNVELLGRQDNQVKLRGFRIELDEIEVVLHEHPAVAEVVVLAREDTPGEKHLVAYVVETQRANVKDYFAFLKAKLPEYMIPDAFVTLDALPLTSNGKIDRKALPVPDAEGFAKGKDFAPPTTPMEQTLAGIWEDILAQKPVGIHDNFFALGGHSLMAMRLVTRIRREMHVDMSLRLLFDSPTICQLAASLNQQVEVTDQQKLVPVDRHAYRDPDGNFVFPTSFMQESLWFLQQFEPQSAVYNAQCSAHIREPLDLATLKRALGELVRRHEILRTTFAIRDGLPVQVVAPSGEIPLTVIDLCHLEGVAREAETVRIVNAEIVKPIDLEHGPLIRAVAIRLGTEEYILCLPQHHITSDGMSMHVLLTELAILYHDFSQDRPASLPALPVQYAEYTLWQRDLLSSERLEQLVTFWREHLNGAPTTINLPTDRPRLPLPSFAGARYFFTLPLDLHAALKEMCQREEVTLYTAVLTALAILLYRYSGQEDLLIGSPVAGRDQAEIEPLLGAFINSVVLRCDLSDTPTFRELMGRMQHETRQVLSYQDIPFDSLVQRLHPERIAGQNPLFQIMLAYWKIMDLPYGWRQAFANVQSDASKFDLTVVINDHGDWCDGICEYSTDLFDETTIERMMAQLTALLESAVTHPDQPITTLSLISERERQHILAEWNAKAEPSQHARCVHHLLEDQAERRPAAIAAIYGAERLTFGELNQRANRLAHRLITMGVRPGTLVGLCVERSLDMVIGILGILKAGGAYVPLDPSYPPDRLAFMLADIQAPVIIVHQQTRDILPMGDIKYTLDLDDKTWITPSAEAGNPFIDNLTAHPAYVIYTSGSTGTPKGVLVSHANLASSMAARLEYYTEPITSFLLVLSFAFDTSTAGIFATLCQGGTLVLPQQGDERDPSALAGQISQHAITHTICLTSLYALLLAEEDAAGLASLRAVVVGGESCPLSLAQQHHRMLPHVNLYNEYGVTEASVWSTVYRCGDETRPRIPIGKPIDNTQLYVLDAALQPVPIGIPGELYIGGAGVALGYLNRPELTAERFIPDPFSGQPGARLYRTGDQVRMLDDGNLEYLGRLDHQIKVRGYRIEPGEIEMVLRGHPSVREAAVVPRKDASGNTILVGYAASDSQQVITPSELQRYLRSRLPLYMIPSTLVMLDALLLTPNGKIDRKALPAPENAANEQKAGYVAPTLPIHHQLVEIWEELLPVRPIGIRDNFFDLGGHSLLAARMMQQVEQVWGRKIPLAVLFSEATIEHLATILTELATPTQRTTLVTIQSAGSLPPFFFVPGDWNGGGFYCLEMAKVFGPERPFYVLDLQSLGPDDVPLTIVEMAAEHVRSLQAVQPSGPYHLGGFCIGGLIAYEMARQLRAAGHEVATLVMIDSSPARPHMRLMRTILDRSRHLNRWEKLERFTRILYLDTLMGRAEIRGWQLITGQWRRLAQREQLDLDPSIQIDSSTVQQWMAIYIWAAASYVPAPYDGRITLLWAREALADSPRDHKRVWQRLAAEVDFRLIPGSHNSCVTRHSRDLAAEIKRYLEKQPSVGEES